MGPADSAIVVVEGRAVGQVKLGLHRPDVAVEYPTVPDAERAGWEATADVRGVTGGEAQLTVVARMRSGRWSELAGPQVRLDRTRSGRRRTAVFTIAQNEPVFAGVWVRHYRRFFDPADIYVLDHDTTDGSIARVAHDCTVVPVHRDRSFDHHWLRSVVADFQRFLMRSYDAVLFSEVDELVIADPASYDSLGQYIDGMAEPIARCSGFNVVHQPGEPALSFEENILGQRSRWHPSALYSKPVLTRVPIRWNAGFHDRADGPDPAPDPDLLLVHLHRVDYDYCLSRHRASAARNWNEADALGSIGWQNRVVDPEEFQHWFYHGEDLGPEPDQPIPAHLQAAV